MKVYLSHKISGGDVTTFHIEQKKNCQKAVELGERIKKAVPSIELYIPGGQTEQFVRLAYAKGYLTVQQILNVDCAIIDECDAVIIYVPEGDKLDGGRLVEYHHAIATGKIVYLFVCAEDAINFIGKTIVERRINE